MSLSSPANFTTAIRLCLFASALLSFSVAELSINSFTASLSRFIRFVLSVCPTGSFILPDTSSTSTISSGTVVCPTIFAVEESAESPTRKSEFALFVIVADCDSFCLLVSVTFPVDTDLSVHMRPTFFVLSSRAFASCQLLIVTLSATVLFVILSAAFTCCGAILSTIIAAIINTMTRVIFFIFLFLLYIFPIFLHIFQYFTMITICLFLPARNVPFSA